MMTGEQMNMGMGMGMGMGGFRTGLEMKGAQDFQMGRMKKQMGQMEKIEGRK